MKYRRLNNKELKTLEKEFVKFLAANHVTASDWENLKKEESEKVEGLITIFSDLVIEDTLKEIRYLEFITPHDIKTFFCTEEKIYLQGLTIKNKKEVDFLKMALPKDLAALIHLQEGQVELYSAQKEYQPSRLQELFQMMENGCLISKEGQLFQMLLDLKKGSKTI